MKHSSEKGHFAQPAPPKTYMQSPLLIVHGLNTCVRAEGWGRAAQGRGLCASETRPVLSETSFRLGLMALDATFPDYLLLRTEPPSYCPFAETLWRVWERQLRAQRASQLCAQSCAGHRLYNRVVQ